jgi:hypothetical protein
MSEKDEKKGFFDVFKEVLKIVGIIVLVVVIITFIVAYFLIKTIARPICNWGFLQFLLVLLPFLAEIIGIIVAFTGVGLPVTAVLTVVGAIIEVVSVVCDIVTMTPGDVLGKIFNVVLGLLGTIPIAGLLPQGARVAFKVAKAISNRSKQAQEIAAAAAAVASPGMVPNFRYTA